ncbi:hypothetical protein XENORESO_021957 [Xenotaenia resolanae]|uniref:Uncharacterized protein n=1 Tax=Xenotaenia resolanae TaxID=208358 RepID=A0ABV0WHN2_9TELE
MISRGSRGVPRTEPAFFISLLSFFKSLALMMLPQQMMEKRSHFPQQTYRRYAASCCKQDEDDDVDLKTLNKCLQKVQLQLKEPFKFKFISVLIALVEQTPVTGLQTNASGFMTKHCHLVVTL